MPDWIDDLERKKQKEKQQYDAKMEGIYQDIREQSEKQRQLNESVKHIVDPIFAQLETDVGRAKRTGFFLTTRRGDYWRELRIYRHATDVKGTEDYIEAVAAITLYPQKEGLRIWFTEARISMGWKKDKFLGKRSWYEKQDLGAKIHESPGIIPYGSLSENDLLALVKWIATGNEPIPHFRDVIRVKEWKPPDYTTRGCLYSPWTYIIAFGIILFILYVTSSK